MPSRRSSPPLWFSLCVTVALASALRVSLHVHGVGDAGPGHTPPVSLAFWFFIVGLIEAIWKGLQVAGRVTLEVLAWSVKALWFFATTTANGLKALGLTLARGAKEIWDFFGSVFRRVIVPAFQKFWQWFDKFRSWLDQTFGPILDWLRTVRDNLLLFWKTYVRPWLDLIDVTRKALHVLTSLGVSWARKLDAYLGSLEDKIEKPFRLVLGKLNEVINAVNRIMTLDGLIQRVALVRSLARDYQYAWRAIAQPYTRAVDANDRSEATAKLGAKTLPEIEADTRSYIRDGGGPHAALFNEMAIVWRKQLRDAAPR